MRFQDIFLSLVLTTGFVFAQAPSADTLKQVLTKKLQKLTPEGMTERQVLYQDVRAGAPTGASYPFQVTALIRDYGPGYPRNRFYGTTCVGRFDQQRFALFRNDFGQWDVEGALTPSLDTRQCKQNPSEGVSAIPLATLSGNAAPAGEPAATAPQNAGRGAISAGSGALANGKYECWANGQARMLLNFTATGPGQYTGSDGRPGAYSYDAASTRVTFRSGSLNGALGDGYYAIYHAPGGRPTVSFRSTRSGAEVSFCQLVR